MVVIKPHMSPNNLGAESLQIEDISMSLSEKSLHQSSHCHIGHNGNSMCNDQVDAKPDAGVEMEMTDHNGGPPRKICQ